MATQDAREGFASEGIMPAVRSFTWGQWEALGRRLDALPEKAKDEQHLKVGDGVKSIRTQIGTAREKGYTLCELIEQAAQEGIDVNLNSLRYAIRRTDGKGRIRRESKEGARNHATGSTRVKKPIQTNANRNKPLNAQSTQKGDNAVTRVELPQVQGYLGFPISPDTENL